VTNIPHETSRVKGTHLAVNILLEDCLVGWVGDGILAWIRRNVFCSRRQRHIDYTVVELKKQLYVLELFRDYRPEVVGEGSSTFEMTVPPTSPLYTP
jgi:hypothetical protein